MYHIKNETVGYYRDNPNRRGKNKIFLKNTKNSVDKDGKRVYIKDTTEQEIMKGW